MVNTLKAGIMLIIHSWENDGDANQQVTLTGLTLEQARYYIDFCKLFVSCNNGGEGGVGNMSEISEEEYATLLDNVKALLEKYQLDTEEEKALSALTKGEENYFLMLDRYVQNESCRLLGASEYYIFRVFDRYEAYLLETDVEEITLC